MLSGLTICDFTTRLPGPLSTMALANLNANVIKIENSDRENDPFSSEEIKGIAPNFNDWYENLNHKKTIHQISFKDEATKLALLINLADILVLPASKKVETIIKTHLDDKKPRAMIYVAGSAGEHKAMHDINALATTKTFSFHLEHQENAQMPHLPFGGISFGQTIATTCLAAFLQAKQKNELVEETLYLDKSIQDIFDALYSEKSLHNGKFLHTGLFPCYDLYETADKHYIAIGAVEEKYWNNLLQNFNLTLTIEQRFDTTGTTKSILEKKFKSLSLEEITQQSKISECCLSPCVK